VAAVTGATGFIGSAVVRKLLEQKRSVRCLIEPGANLSNLEGLPVERITCDVTDFDTMKKALDGCETLFHLAAIYKTWLPDEEVIHRVNIEGTVSTLLAAQQAKVNRIVYTSSIAAVGLVDGGLADETTKFNLFDIANPYILTKWQSERIAMRFAASGLPVVVVNPAFPFGPRDITPTPTGAIIRALLNKEVPGSGPAVLPVAPHGRDRSRQQGHSRGPASSVRRQRFGRRRARGGARQQYRSEPDRTPEHSDLAQYRQGADPVRHRQRHAAA